MPAVPVLRFLVLATALGPLASAQPVLEDEGPPAGLEDGPRVSQAGAVLLSLGATAGAVGLGVYAPNVVDSDAVAAALVVGGLLVGPSVGNLVQGEYGDAAVGAGLRTLGAGLLAGAFASTFMNAGLNEADTYAVGAAVVVVGVAFLGGSVYDVTTARLNARDARVRVRPRGAGLALEVGL